MTVVTRFAPSPTGFLHIGGARTALYNWLFAKHNNGKFLLRIEDTDRKRYTKEAVEAIKESLNWMGLDWDGEAISQFERANIHKEIAEQLVKKGKAYYCYCSPEELEQMREKAKNEGKRTFYDRRWRDADPSTAPKDIKPVIRIKAPIDGSTIIEDKVQGRVEVKNNQLDDFILLRSDGSPTYMLSVVVDDHDMNVTHIIRGDDHLNNTFRQKIIYDAMGWNLPVYAHIPLIHGSDGKKLSKRHGAVGTQTYKDLGYLPEAINNYLLRLGWGHGDEEIIPMDKAIELFSLEAIGKAAACFDIAKLEHINSYYMNQKSNEELAKLIEPFLENDLNIKPSPQAQERIISGMNELKSRAKNLKDLASESAFYAISVPFPYTEKAKSLLNDEGKMAITELLTNFEKLSDFNAKEIEQICKKVANEKFNGKLGKVAMPLRAALTGTTISPSIFHAAEILGIEEVRNRIQEAIKQ